MRGVRYLLADVFEKLAEVREQTHGIPPEDAPDAVERRAVVFQGRSLCAATGDRNGWPAVREVVRRGMSNRRGPLPARGRLDLLLPELIASLQFHFVRH